MKFMLMLRVMPRIFSNDGGTNQSEQICYKQHTHWGEEEVGGQPRPGHASACVMPRATCEDEVIVVLFRGGKEDSDHKS